MTRSTSGRNLKGVALRYLSYFTCLFLTYIQIIIKKKIFNANLIICEKFSITYCFDLFHSFLILIFQAKQIASFDDWALTEGFFVCKRAVGGGWGRHCPPTLRDEYVTYDESIIVWKKKKCVHVLERRLLCVSCRNSCSVGQFFECCQ